MPKGFHNNSNSNANSNLDKPIRGTKMEIIANESSGETYWESRSLPRGLLLIQGSVMMSRMGWPAKLALVIGGYVLACLLAVGLMYAYESLPQDPALQASAGMAAFGDLIMFVALLGFLALFPSAL